MKKTICLAALLSIVLLAGCFGFRNDTVPAKVSEGTSTMQPSKNASETVSESSSKTAPQQKEAPKFEDGQLYLQAIAKHDLAMCVKISDATLKAKCQTEVKGYSSKK